MFNGGRSSRLAMMVDHDCKCRALRSPGVDKPGQERGGIWRLRERRYVVSGAAKGAFVPVGNTSLRVPLGALAVNLASSRFCDNAGSCATGLVWLRNGCRRTVSRGHGGENAPRICIFCDMSVDRKQRHAGCRLTVEITEPAATGGELGFKQVA